MTTKWDKPLYEYTLPSREVVINVSRSCPSFSKPTPGVADVAAELARDGRLRVLDFGAGKLRNTLFLLRHRAGFCVSAVEYQDCFKTPAGAKRLKAAKRYKKFFFLTYPSVFLAAKLQVDAVFLINVANVIPDEEDRRLIIAECTERLRRGGWFLWMSQYGEPHYKPGVTRRLRVADGWCYNLAKHEQTFFKEFKIPEIHGYFASNQYKLIRGVNAAHHRAFLFERH